MRSVTIFLLASSWERDFSCLSMSSSTFSNGFFGCLFSSRHNTCSLFGTVKSNKFTGRIRYGFITNIRGKIHFHFGGLE